MDRKETLQTRLEDAGIEQQHVAKDLDLSRALVSRVVNGRYPLRTPKSRATQLAVLAHIALRMGLSIEDVQALVPQNTEEMQAAAAAAHGGPRALDRRTISGRRHQADRRAQEREHGKSRRALAS
jgi:transcriptional regulator with XRE-family HTH domain